MVTKNELKLLRQIYFSDYHDGRDPVNNPTWFENPFESKEICSGVMASLVKKGLARSRDLGDQDHTVSITSEGAKIVKASES